VVGSAPDVAAILLTTGKRTTELHDALRSVTEQRDVTAERIVVWNGCGRVGLDGVVDRDIELETNVGIPEGRNRGTAASAAPVLLFLDDDARLLDAGTLAGVVSAFDQDPQLAVIGMRIVDGQGETSRRHVPRIGHRGADRAGDVTSFPGGACCIRRAAFEAAGGFLGDYFYAMEETDLAWRLIDRGWTIRYDPSHRVFHPRTQPSRHDQAAWRTARNRTWLAHRLLPMPLAAAYVATWLLVSVARPGSASGDYARGARDGWRTRVGPRSPMRWRTVWKLTRLGRPPIL
jgi:GT2 family glycosyltransferase